MAVRTEIEATQRIPIRKSWWRRPWIGPLAVIVVAFLAYSLPPYLAFDPTKSRVPQPEGFPAHFWFLVAHIAFGTVAILGVLIQIWPWFRRKYPVAHRRIGRIYVFGGAVPSALIAGTIGTVTPFGPVTGMLDVVAALLWLGCTIAGWRAVRQRRFADHRKRMIRGFAMTMNTLVTRLYTPFLIIAFGPRLHTTFAGTEKWVSQTISAMSAGLSLVTLLVLSQLWLDRRPAIAR